MSEDKITRERIQSDLADVLRNSYDRYEKEEKNLKNAINGVIEFFLVETQKDQKIPYQYLQENQIEFYKHANVISMSLSHVEPVLSDMKTRMYSLEKGHNVIEANITIDAPQQMTQATPPPKKSLFPDFRKSKKPAPTLPYQSTIELQKKTEDVIHFWELVVEWQAYGLDLTDEFDRYGLDTYLSNHRNMFNWNVAPNILRIFKQGMELQLDREKKYAIQGLTANMKESAAFRNDMVKPN